jgi:hypothetical protein
METVPVQTKKPRADKKRKHPIQTKQTTKRKNTKRKPSTPNFRSRPNDSPSLPAPTVPITAEALGPDGQVGASGKPAKGKAGGQRDDRPASPSRPRARMHRPPPTSTSPDLSPNMPRGTPGTPTPAPEPTPPLAGPEQPTTALQPPVQQAAAKQAEILWTALIPAFMTRILGVEGYVQAPGCRYLLDRLISNTGGPADAVEVMLIEQLTMAHYRVAALQAQSGEAKSLEAAQVYNTAAARMLAEFQKTVLTLQTYREKAIGLARAECRASPSGAASSHTGAKKQARGKRR